MRFSLPEVDHHAAARHLADRQRGAVVGRLQTGELIAVIGEDPGNLFEEDAARRGRQPRPSRERGLCRGDRLIDVVAVARGDLGPHLAGRGIHRVQ